MHLTGVSNQTQTTHPKAHKTQFHIFFFLFQSRKNGNVKTCNLGLINCGTCFLPSAAILLMYIIALVPCPSCWWRFQSLMTVYTNLLLKPCRFGCSAIIQCCFVVCYIDPFDISAFREFIKMVQAISYIFFYCFSATCRWDQKIKYWWSRC